jgi:hypothetical protein
MGLYDEIHAKIICPHCHKETEIWEQIKWTECTLSAYTIGDKIINITNFDGIVEIDVATSMRDQLTGICEHCDGFIPFTLVLDNGVIKEFKIK